MALGEASVRIVPDTSGFAARVKKDVDDALNGVDKSVKETTDGIEDNFEKAGKEASQAVDGISSEFKKLGKLVAGAAIGKAVLSFAKSSIDAASDLGESINAVQVTFKELSDEILDFSKVSATAVGLSSADFNSFAVQFAGFTKQIATGSKNAAAVTKELTTRIADFASVMNLDLNEAAVVFASTLAGESEAIRRFGIDMSAASIEAFALSSGLISNKNEMTAAIKVQATYAKLMADTAQVAGDFANTSDSLANRQRILAAEFKNMQVEVGNALIPTMGDLLGIVGDVVGAFTSLPEGIQKTITVAVLAGGAFIALSSALQGVGLAASTANIAVAGVLVVTTGLMLVYKSLQANAAESRARQQELNTALENANDPTLTLMSQMKNLIATYNELNPASENAANGIGQINGSVDLVKSKILEFLPAVNKAGISLETLSAEASRGGDNFITVASSLGNFGIESGNMSGHVDELSDLLNTLIGEGDSLNPVLMALARNGGLTATEFGDLLVELAKTADAFDSQREEIDKQNQSMLTSVEGSRALTGILGDELYGSLVRNADELANNAGRTDEWTWLLEEVARRVQTLGYELDTTTGEIVVNEDALNGVSDAATTASDEMLAYVKGLGFVVSESGQVEMSQENMATAVGLAQDRFDAAVQAVEDYEDALSDAFDAARSSIDTGFDLVESQIAATTALAEYAKAAKSGSTNSAELDQIARDTAKTLLTVADNTVTNAEALAAMRGESITTAQRQEMMITELEKFRDTLNPTSPLAQYLNGFISTLGTVPTEIPIEMQAEVDAAQRELELFKDAAKTIGREITFGILEALAPLSPEFKKILDKMRAEAGKDIALNVRINVTSNGDYVTTPYGSMPVRTPAPAPMPPSTGPFPNIDFSDPFWAGVGFADGGIFNQPQIGLFAEAGAEAIIPLTRPARALELMRESGLLGLAQQSSGAGQNFDIKVVSAEPMRTAKDVVREFQALEYRMGPL